MKVNQLILISLIIVILTMTTVNASHAEDNLTVSKNIVDNISQIDEIKPVGDLEDIDYDVQTPSEVRVGDLWDDEDEEDFSVNVEFHDSTKGNLKILVDNKIVKEINNISEEYLYSYDLRNLNIGIHNYTIKYSGDDEFKPVEIFKEFEVFYIKTKILELNNGENCINVNFAYNTKGTLDIYIDNKKVKSFNVYDDRLVNNEIINILDVILMIMN